jgi:hypothetical protein
MPQGVLPYKYEEEKKEAGLTALAGLPLYLDGAVALGLPASISRHLTFRPSQGWTDSQMVLSLILLALAGGDCVDDLKVLQTDEGFCRILERIEPPVSPSRWRKGPSRTIPSPSAVFRYLAAFRSDEASVQGRAFIPQSRALAGLSSVNSDLVAALQRVRPHTTATLDMDATLIATTKKEALFSYEGYKAYQPLNVSWAEQELCVRSEFRDGNVPANYDLLRVFTEALDILPHGVTKVRLRSDAAGYVHDLLAYCANGENERFGRIEFAVSCPVTEAFKDEVVTVPDAAWKALDHGREWTEVPFVPNELARSKKGEPYRYLAIREVLRQSVLPGMDLPFPTLDRNGTQYKLRAIVSNMDWEGGRLMRFSYERCGKSEEAHGILKDDLAGGKLPSGNFGENAAWWGIMVLAFNLNTAMKQCAFEGSWATKRMKAIRFHLINLPGRIVSHAREAIIRIVKNHPSFGLLVAARQRILRWAPSG